MRIVRMHLCECVWREGEREREHVCMCACVSACVCLERERECVCVCVFACVHVSLRVCVWRQRERERDGEGERGSMFACLRVCIPGMSSGRVTASFKSSLAPSRLAMSSKVIELSSSSISSSMARTRDMSAAVNLRRARVQVSECEGEYSHECARVFIRLCVIV